MVSLSPWAFILIVAGSAMFGYYAKSFRVWLANRIP